MKNIKLLDCTLRDGGYVNEFNFGKTNIINIIKMLNNSDVEIIECGFLDVEHIYDENKTIYNSVNKLLKLGKNLFNKF